MSSPVRIDSHIHIYQDAQSGIAAKEGYEIWEYGRQADVAISGLAGTVQDLLGAMKTANISRSVLVNLFIAEVVRQEFIDALPSDLGPSQREKALGEIEERLRQDFVAFNRWACEIGRDHPEIVTFICADVNLLSDQENADHLRDLAESDGARGIKLHGPAQEFHMGDKRLWPTYALCQELGLPVVGHSGPDLDGKGFAEPRAFGDALAAFPDLPIVLAHMGGATWQQAREIAEIHANAYFDCCEIIEWTESDNGPNDQELAQLIVNVGSDRVMMGSDFPWYDLDRTIDRVMELPLLSVEEKEAIIGANAVRILRLDA
ncbi:MAG: amidohydrolase [Alphaproteobacteria bacterium]|nr:amidohydrolase [Alphaproteobacteria bacterium]